MLSAASFFSIGFAQSSSASTLTLFDGTFGNTTAYSPYQIHTSGTESTCISCGNPGQAISIGITFISGSGLYAQVVLDNALTYDPAVSGAITSLSTSVDKDLTISVAATGTTSAYHPTILQDGTLYLGTIVSPNTYTFGNGGGTTGWYTFDVTGLTAASFVSYNPLTSTYGTGNPDFSGDPLTFGLAQFANGTGSYTDSVLYDNLQFGVTSPTPEPSSIALLGTGLLGGAGWLRRRSQRT